MERLRAELIDSGAVVIAITGSRARGNAHDRSDLDVIAIGDGPRYDVDVWDGVLVAQAWSSEDEQTRRFTDPREIGASVPGWREAVLLHDPEGVGASLQRRALQFEWSAVDAACDAWVGDEVAGYAEEVQKLVAALEARNTLSAAVLRTLLAFRMPRIAAVHHRLLYGSENVLFDLVGRAMGREWRETHAAALSVNGESFEKSCLAALRLYRLTGEAARDLLDERRQRVFRHALAVVEEVRPA